MYFINGIPVYNKTYKPVSLMLFLPNFISIDLGNKKGDVLLPINQKIPD
jgi:hypothetical protein